jgi:UDP-N-acetylmuramate-alanine ligase
VLTAARDGDLVLMMGAGSIGGIAPQLANRMRSVNGAA